MTPSPDLFLLIKSLKQTEKRYFKIYASKLSEGKQSEYLQLFQAIDAMPVYDEQKLKQKFKDKAFVKQLHVVKNYLNGVVLQALVGYHYESSAHNNLARLLQTIEILYDRELHSLCMKQIEKGIRICKTYNKQGFLFLFLDWQTKILVRRQQYEDVLTVVEEQKQITNNLYSYLEAKEQAIKIHHRLITKGFPRTNEEVEVLRKETLKLMDQQSSQHATTEEEYYRLFSLANFYAGTGEHLKRAEIMRQLTDILEKNKNYALEHPSVYISVLNNYYNALANSGQLKPARQVFLKIRQLAEQINPKRYDARNYALLVSYDIQFEIATLINETDNVLELIPIVKEIIEKAEGVFQKSNTLELIFNTARVCFISGKFIDALDWVNRIINEQQAHVREDLNAAARILYLIIHYELGNDILLKNVITSTKNSLKYKRRLFKAEQTVLDFLKKLLVVKSEKERRTIFESLPDTLDIIFSDPGESKPAFLTDVSAWIKSKIEGKHMGEILAESYLKEVGGE